MSSTPSVSELPVRPTSVEVLHFTIEPGETLTAYDLVNALVGVTWALDDGINARDEDHNRRVRGGLETAARILAEQLQARINWIEDRPAQEDER